MSSVIQSQMSVMIRASFRSELTCLHNNETLTGYMTKGFIIGGDELVMFPRNNVFHSFATGYSSVVVGFGLVWFLKS